MRELLAIAGQPARGPRTGGWSRGHQWRWRHEWLWKWAAEGQRRGPIHHPSVQCLSSDSRWQRSQIRACARIASLEWRSTCPVTRVEMGKMESAGKSSPLAAWGVSAAVLGGHGPEGFCSASRRPARTGPLREPYGEPPQRGLSPSDHPPCHCQKFSAQSKYNSVPPTHPARAVACFREPR